MRKIKVELENCYGIKRLTHEFDFSGKSSFAIYAPNGSMKSSFAKVFKDIQNGEPSKDRIFQSRSSKRKVTDENDTEIPKESVFAISPYDEEMGHTEKTSTLLVDSRLRREYEQLHVEIEKAKNLLLSALKDQSGSKKDLEREISETFTRRPDQFFIALNRIKDELSTQKEAPFSTVPYDKIFDEKVLSFLATKDFKTAIENYIKRFNELLSASSYFKKGVFNYYNAATIAKNLADNGFFSANHKIVLTGKEAFEVTTQKQLEDLIKKEKDEISKDSELKKKFAEIEKLLTKNVTLRDFEAYLIQHEDILPKLANMDAFREELWKSYLFSHHDKYLDLLSKFQAAEKRKKEIEAEASRQRTQWEEVIAIFNDRFFVPFKLTAKNRVSVILGQEAMLSLGFTFVDGTENAQVERTDLIRVLSTGEKKALYILNILFEIEARRKAGQATLFVIDDIADSFDYKNKYAIIQYLKEIAEDQNFKQILLTHNFDFFRTISTRFISYSQCLMAYKSNVDVTIRQASGVKNIFVKDWKPNFFADPKKKIASIPFIRNIVEYTRGEADPEFVRLTSLLHWKADSATILEGDLHSIFCGVFSIPNPGATCSGPIINRIFAEADDCLNSPDGANFENKIVLSIAIRLSAEKYMISKISDPAFVSQIDQNQTQKLLKKFKDNFPAEKAAIETVQRVVLMTPENIHLNSFMYEPILDMSDEHLKRLYQEVKTL